MVAETHDWLAGFPGLSPLAPRSLATLQKASIPLKVASGAHVFSPGQMPTHYLLALSGSIRVQKTSESGREIVLYRVTAGESCVLTTSCLIGDEAYEAEAIAESDVTAIGIPRPFFEDVMANDADFRRFVFSGFSHRMTGLLRLIDEVAFERIDTRLAHKLLELSDEHGVVTKTQAQLAAELGSAREVVSRQLQEFQRHGWIAVGRGSITIADLDALSRYGRSG